MTDSKSVVVALVNCWRPTQTLALERLSAMVDPEKVRDLSIVVVPTVPFALVERRPLLRLVTARFDVVALASEILKAASWPATFTLPEKVEVELPVTLTVPWMVEVPVEDPWIVVVAEPPTNTLPKAAILVEDAPP